ncbi:hypothetical protein RF55_15807 [Lasius niger]|uniref:Uncharacterized protein n=1 Tax=Lasius niger TaxID=67767 RepID=A0A0J7K5Q8_LASNI|nr:hypothetical protein RF55_15807 [Lasius niger]
MDILVGEFARCKNILAHGKRSDAPTMRILSAKTLLSGSPQNNIAHSSKAQWTLSGLITGQLVSPLMDKYPVRWNDFPKDKTIIPSKWDMAPMNDDSTIPIRIPINNENENKRKISNAQGIMRSMNEKLENIPEILLVSTDEYDMPINNPQKLDILKFLNEKNGNTK